MIPGVIASGWRVQGSPPAAFAPGDWDLSDAMAGGALRVTVLALPVSPGSAILSIQASLDGGGWIDLGGAVPDGYLVSATEGAATSVRLRAVNSFGPGEPSAAKSATPTLAYRYTRIRMPGSYAIDETNDGGRFVNGLQLAGVVFRATAGGAALTGTYSASFDPSFTVSGNNLANFTDDNPATSFRQVSAQPYVQTLAGGHWVQIEHSTPQNVREVVLTAPTGSGEVVLRTPSVMVVEGSQDAATWDMLWADVAIPVWSSGQVRTLVPDATTPIMYRARCPATRSSVFLALAEISWRAGTTPIAGTLYASASIDSTSFRPALAQDASASTFWTTGGNPAPTGGHWLALATLDQTPPTEVRLTVRPDAFREDPLDMVLERSLDGGVTWSALATYTAIPAWSAGETRTFTL